MKKIVLMLDTTRSHITVVKLKTDHAEKIYCEERKDHSSQRLLPLINKALKTEKLTLLDISALEITLDQGSFTGTRVGVAVANTLAWILDIPVNGQTIVFPIYNSSKFDV